MSVPNHLALFSQLGSFSEFLKLFELLVHLQDFSVTGLSMNEAIFDILIRGFGIFYRPLQKWAIQYKSLPKISPSCH